MAIVGHSQKDDQLEKRRREQTRKQKQQDKQQRRTQRETEKRNNPTGTIDKDADLKEWSPVRSLARLSISNEPLTLARRAL